MGDKRPFRFIWNRSEAIGTNLYLMLYPQKGLAAMLRQHPERGGDVLGLLAQVTGHELVDDQGTPGQALLHQGAQKVGAENIKRAEPNRPGGQAPSSPANRPRVTRRPSSARARTVSR